MLPVGERGEIRLGRPVVRVDLGIRHGVGLRHGAHGLPVPALRRRGGALALVRQDDRVVQTIGMLERHVRRPDVWAIEFRQHLGQVVGVRRDEGIAGLLAAKSVRDAVRAGEVLPRPARGGDEQRVVGAIRPLKHADAARPDEPDQPAKKRQAVRAGEPLEHVVADDQVERARRREQLRVGLEGDVIETTPPGLSPRQVEHDGRPIHRRDRTGTLRERQREPPQTTAVFEHRHRRELRRQARVDDPQHPRHDSLAARKELALVFGSQVGPEEARVRQHGEMRLPRREGLQPGIGWRLQSSPTR